MAVRGWGGSVATAIGVAAGAGRRATGPRLRPGHHQLAAGPTAPVEAAWAASLAWATWIAATSTVAGRDLGAAAARPGRRRPGRRTADAGPKHDPGRRRPAVGALVTVLLVAVPARAARGPDTFSPQTIAAGYAVLGRAGRLGGRVLVAASRAAATNVIATTGWLWLLAVISVIDGVRLRTGLTSRPARHLADHR